MEHTSCYASCYNLRLFTLLSLDLVVSPEPRIKPIVGTGEIVNVSQEIRLAPGDSNEAISSGEKWPFSNSRDALMRIAEKQPAYQG